VRDKENAEEEAVKFIQSFSLKTACENQDVDGRMVLIVIGCVWTVLSG
jgi:hypothetical protein